MNACNIQRPSHRKGEAMFKVIQYSSVDLTQSTVVAEFETADEACDYRDAHVVDTYSNVSTEPDCDYLYIKEEACP